MNQPHQDVGKRMTHRNKSKNPPQPAFWILLIAVATMVVAMVNPHAASATRVRRQATAGHRKHHHHATKKKHKLQGQRAMEPQRVTEIQQALIREHYLQGAPSGKWDASSQSAMQKFQASNGWQTKVTPDSRALIKLGLGPKQDAGEYAASNMRLKNPASAAAAQDPAVPDPAVPDHPAAKTTNPTP